MANTSLPNLTERTATANTDLIHVNSGGTDYKETKGNFLSDVNSSITSLNNSLENSYATTELLQQLGIPTSATSYNCDWSNYRFLIVCQQFYSNIRATVVVPNAYFAATNPNTRIQLYSPTESKSWQIYKNGNSAVYIQASTSDSTNGVRIFGVERIS